MGVVMSTELENLLTKRNKAVAALTDILEEGKTLHRVNVEKSRAGNLIIKLKKNAETVDKLLHDENHLTTAALPTATVLSTSESAKLLKAFPQQLKVRALNLINQLNSNVDVISFLEESRTNAVRAE